MGQVADGQKSRILRFLKEWTLIISIALGTIGFFVFKYVEWLQPVRHHALVVSQNMMPVLIFVMLFLTFCKVDLRQYCFKKWYVGAIVIQLAVVFGLVGGVKLLEGLDMRFAIEGCVICVIAPTATAAAVIVKKLGGCVPTITTYTLIAGFVTAIIVPIMLPMLPAADLQMHDGLNFLQLFSVIIGKVFPLLISPFIATILLRLVSPKANHYIATRSKDMAFYLWGLALVINMAQTIHAIDNCDIDLYHVIMIAIGGLAACLFQFEMGQVMGRAYGDSTSCRQGMGQKNTIISIWIALTYMNPITAVAPGSYVVWQNIINSYQLWKKEKEEDSM